MRLTWMTALLVGLLTAGAAQAAPRLGDAPRFVGQSLDGRPVDLAALRGHVVVVDLWATWCPPCRVEMPVLDSIYQARRGAGVEVLGLSADRAHDVRDARKVMAAFHFSSALLAGARINDFGEPKALPQTLVLDSSGRVRALFGAGGQPFSAGALNAAIDAAGGP